MVALLVFLICATVGAVVLTAASSSAGKAGSATTDENIARYSLEYAAKEIISELSQEDSYIANSTEYSSSTSAYDFYLTEEWNFKSVYADYVSTLSNASGYIYCGTSAPSTYLIATSSSDYLTSYSTEKKAVRTYGTYVLDVDGSSDTTASSVVSDYPDQLTDTTADIDYSWSDQWVGIQSSLAYRNASLSMDNLRDLRNQMWEAVVVNYWDQISNPESTSTETSDTSTEETNVITDDPWGLSTPDDITLTEWDNLVSENDYSVQTSDPLTIQATSTVENTTNELLPVYANFKMTAEGVFEIELYCGTADHHEEDDVASRLWIIYEPDTENLDTVISYSQSPNATSTGLTPLYKPAATGQTETVMQSVLTDAQSIAETNIKNTWNGDYFADIDSTSEIKDNNDNITGYQFTYNVYQNLKASPQKTVTQYDRSITICMNWGEATISTESTTE